MRRLCWVALAAVIAWPLAARAQDEPPLARLQYARGPGAERCPDEEGLRAAVSARLGRDPFVPDAPVTIEARIDRSGAELRAYIALRDSTGTRQGERNLSSTRRDCAQLAESMALAISIAVDPVGAMGGRPEPVAEPSTPADPDVVAPEPVAQPAPPPSAPDDAVAPPPDTSAHPLALRLAIRGAFVAWSAPHASGGLVLAAGAQYGRLSIDVEGRIDLPTSSDMPSGGGTFGSHLVLAILAPCAHVDVVSLCGLLAAGSLRGETSDARGRRIDGTPYAAAGARVGLTAPLSGPWLVTLTGDLLATLTRTTLRAGEAVLWVTPPLSLAIALGLGASFS